MTNQYTKALIVVHREESADDFREIAMRIKKLDPTICGAMAPEYISEEMLPPHFLALPLLVVYLVNPPASNAEQGIICNATNLTVENLNKIQEYDHFKKHNIPCLPIENFQWGMELDPAIYGDWVVLKPANIQSTGQDINMVPTKLIPKLTLADFPVEHLIHKDDYLVQKFVKCGKNPTHYRALVFLGDVILSFKAEQKSSYPNFTSVLNTLLRTSVASNMQDHRNISLIIDGEMNELAKKVSKTLPDYPLLGIDVMRDEETSKLYVIEINGGGNTWAFSSEMAQKLRLQVSREALVEQYAAWDVAAEALVMKTNELTA